MDSCDVDVRRIWCMRRYRTHEMIAHPSDIHLPMICKNCGLAWRKAIEEGITYDTIYHCRWPWLEKLLNGHVWRHRKPSWNAPNDSIVYY